MQSKNNTLKELKNYNTILKIEEIKKEQLTNFIEYIIHSNMDISDLIDHLASNKLYNLLDILLTYTDILVLKRINVFNDRVIIWLKYKSNLLDTYQVFTQPRLNNSDQSNKYTQSKSLTISSDILSNILASLHIEYYSELMHGFGQEYHNQLIMVNNIILKKQNKDYNLILVNHSLINNWHEKLILTIVESITMLQDETIQFLIEYIKKSQNVYSEQLGAFLLKIDNLVASLLGKAHKNCDLIRVLKQVVINTKRDAINKKTSLQKQSLLYDLKVSNKFLEVVQQGNLEYINKMLSDERIDVNIQDEYGKTALMYAIELKNELIVRLLLDYVNVNICDYNLNSPLHYLYMYRHFYETRLFEVFIRKGACIYGFNSMYEVVALQVASDVCPELNNLNCVPYDKVEHPVLIEHLKNKNNINLVNLKRCK